MKLKGTLFGFGATVNSLIPISSHARQVNRQFYRRYRIQKRTHKTRSDSKLVTRYHPKQSRIRKS